MQINRSVRLQMVRLMNDIKGKTVSLEELFNHILLCSNLQLLMRISAELLHSSLIGLGSLLTARLLPTRINATRQKEKASSEGEDAEGRGHVRTCRDFSIRPSLCSLW